MLSIQTPTYLVLSLANGFMITCLSKLSRDYFDFFQEWFTNFHNPITIICFEEMVKDPVNEVRRMLNFLEFPDYRKSANHIIVISIVYY